MRRLYIARSSGGNRESLEWDIRAAVAPVLTKGDRLVTGSKSVVMIGSEVMIGNERMHRTEDIGER